MQNDSVQTWAETLALRIGREVRRTRLKKGMTAVQLAERTAELGHTINRNAIAKLENGHRGAKFDVSELIILAAALDVPPVQLIYPGLIFKEEQVLPGRFRQAWLAVCWFTGEKPLQWTSREDPDIALWQDNARPLILMRDMMEGFDYLKDAEERQNSTAPGTPERERTIEDWRIADRFLRQLMDTMKREGLMDRDMAPDFTVEESGDA